MAEQVGAIEVKASLNTRDYTSGADQIDKDNKRINKSADDVDKSNGKLGKSFANLGKVAAAGIAVIAVGLAGIAVSALKSFGESQAVMAQTEAVIKSTGGAAGQTAKQVSDLAGSLQKVTRFSDETIQTGENMLLTFTNIGKDVFPQATKTMLDMAQAMGGDVKGTAIQLGKALNDPTQGMTALTRVGVTFTDSQKDQIKALQESGDLLGAQTIILKELQKEFGGSAEAAGKTLPGQLDILKNRFNNVMESIGGAIAGSGVLNGLSKILGNVADALEKVDFGKLFSDIAKSDIVQGLVAGFKEFVKIMTPVIQFLQQMFTELLKNKEVTDGLKVIIFGLAIALGVIIGLIVAVAAVVGLLIIGIAQLIGKITQFVQQSVAGFMIALNAVTQFFSGIITWAGNAWRSIQSFFGGIGAWFTNVFNQAKNGMVNAFNGMISFAAGIPGRIVSFFTGVGQSIGQAIKNALNSFLHLPLKIPSITVGGKTIGGQTLIPALANGGIVSSATLAMVGEGREPEAIIPLSKLETMLSGGFNNNARGVQVGTIIINRDVDVDVVARKLGIEQLQANRGIA